MRAPFIDENSMTWFLSGRHLYHRNALIKVNNIEISIPQYNFKMLFILAAQLHIRDRAPEDYKCDRISWEADGSVHYDDLHVKAKSNTYTTCRFICRTKERLNAGYFGAGERIVRHKVSHYKLAVNPEIVTFDFDILTDSMDYEIRTLSRHLKRLREE